MRRWRRAIVDILALALLAAYGWSIRHTRAGSADPTWTEIARRGVLRVGSDPSFHPFAAERDGRWSGYDVDLANEIGKRLGLRVELKAVSYDALYDTLAAGDVDMLASALPLAPEQGWRARFSTPYLDAGQVLVAGVYSPIRSTDDLGGRVVGAALGSEGDTILRSLGRQNPTITGRSEYETPEAALQALQQGRLEVVITDTVSALGLTQNDRHFRIVSPGITFEPYVLAMPIGAYQLQSNVDKTLDDLRREGFFTRLNARWFAQPATNGQ